MLLLAIASVQIALFTAKIDTSSKATQADFIIDVYYFIDLGRQIVAENRSTGQSLWELVEQYRPNPPSTGITYLNALYASAIQDGGNYWAAAVQCLLLVAVAARTWPSAPLKHGLRLALLGGLLPYILLPSKESFVVAGYLVFLVGWFRPPRRLVPTVVGVTLVAAARPEAAILLVLAAAIHHGSRRPYGWLVVCAVFGAVYYFVRDTLFEISTLIQELASLRDDFFCEVGPVRVCATDENFEFLILKRLFVVAGLPLKWVGDFILALPAADAVDLVIKSSLVLQLAWVLLLRRELNRTAFQRPMQRFSLIFAAVYAGSFAGVILFQPSRQIALALCLFLVTLQVSGERSR